MIKLEIYRVTDKEFLPYGNILDIDTKNIVEEAQKIKMPVEGSIYVASKEEFEKLPIMNIIKSKVFGGIPMGI